MSSNENSGFRSYPSQFVVVAAALSTSTATIFPLVIVLRKQTCTTVSATYSTSQMSPVNHFTFSHTFPAFARPMLPQLPPHPSLAASDDRFLTSIVKHHEYCENKKFLGRHFTHRPTAVVTTTTIHQHYCLTPATVVAIGRFGPLNTVLFGSTNVIQQPYSNTPSLPAHSFRTLFPAHPARVPANTVASLAATSVLKSVSSFKSTTWLARNPRP